MNQDGIRIQVIIPTNVLDKFLIFKNSEKEGLSRSYGLKNITS